MSSENNTLTLTLRVTPKLAADLKQLAQHESNTASAVVRRILTKELARELQPAPRRDHDRKR